MKHLKKMLSLLMCLALCASFSVTAAAENSDDVWGDVLQDNFMRITTTDAWNKGTAENVVVVPEVGNGAIRLAEGQLEGTWTSEEIDVPAFEYMVASWSSDTPEGASVEIQARVYVDMHSAWSGWLSWGKWGTSIKRSSANTTEDLAKVDTDILTIRGSDGETSSRIQLRAVLRAAEGGKTPTLRDLSTTSKNTLEGQAIPIYHPEEGIELPEKVLLDTPAYSQMRRDSAIGSVICSPTTMTMLLNDRDSSLDLFPEELALRNYDFIYEGFGNWPFTTAIAGSYGYSAYVHYADLDFLRQELAAGRSVGISVKYANSPSGSNPYLENGAANDTNGHLISIVGYETIDGVDYFYSNDAATNPDSQCALRRYRADQLDVCWGSHVAYSVSPEPEVGAGEDAPARIEGELVATEQADVYALMVNGEEVVLSSNFARKTSVLGGGTAFLIADNAATDEMPEPVETTTANKALTYFNVTGKGQVYLSTAKLQQDGVKEATAYIFVNNGPTYVATVSIPEPEVVEPETPAAPETPAEPEAPVETPVEETPAPEAPAEEGGLNPAIIVIGVVIVVAAVLVIVKSKKK